MHGPFHDFLLVNKKQYDYSQYIELINHPSRVQISDDLIIYMNDSFKWIPTFNPAKKETHQGLCMYGPTVIKDEGAIIAEKIFNSWISLFAQGPERLTLRGCFSWMNGSSPDSGEYETLEFLRDEIIESLLKISEFCRKVKDSKNEFYLLHLGV